jgi:hypothetical protein
MIARLAVAGIAVLALVSCSTTESAQKPWEGGAKFERSAPVTLAELEKNGASMAGKQIQIEGTVSQVCAHRGCWVEVSDGSTKVIARSTGDKVLFPRDCTGRKVLVQGVVRVEQAGAKGEGSGEGSEGSGGGGNDGCPQPKMYVEIQGAQLP